MAPRPSPAGSSASVPRCRRSRRPRRSTRAATVGSRPVWQRAWPRRSMARSSPPMRAASSGASRRTADLPVDRERLATLPGQPPADVPLVCLDTETTGLATAAGTVAFLIGLGWWVGDRFRQVQLLLPDHGEERALLTALEAAIPPDAWLVTYNGRGFDWPLLTTRYRLSRRAAPAHAGHLDLLPIVRRLFRHRMPDARLRTAEAELLGMHRRRRRRGLGDPGPLPRVPARRPGRGPRRGRPPQRPGRPVAGLAARPHRTPARRPGDAATGAARRPRRSGPRVRPGATAARGARLPRRGRGPADELRTPDRPATAARPARHVACRRPGDARGRAVVVAPATGRLRRTADGASRRHRSDPAARRSGSPGRWSGSPSIAPTSCADSGGTRTRSGPGRRWPPARVGRPSSPRSSWPRSTSIAGTIRRARAGGRATAVSARSSAAAGSGGPSPRSRPTCCGASSGSGRASRVATGSVRRRASRPLFDRLDLRVLARADRQADPFPGTADEHGRPIRDPGQADVLDRERAGGGREAKVRGPSRARPPDDRRSQAPRPAGPPGTCRRHRSDRSPGPWRSAGSGPCPGRTVGRRPGRSRPPCGALGDEQVGPRVEERGQVGQAACPRATSWWLTPTRSARRSSADGVGARRATSRPGTSSRSIPCQPSVT